MGHENTPTFFIRYLCIFFLVQLVFFSQGNSIIQRREDAMVLVKTKKAPRQKKCTTA